MFRRKSKTEQIQNQSESLASTAATIADQLRERLVPAVGQATENAKDWARPRVERGIEVAAPRLESAVSGLAPKVDTARDKIVDELIPRIAEAISAWAAASGAAKDEAVSRGQGAAAVLSGDAVAAPKGRKKRKVLLALGLIGGGAAAAVFTKKSAPKDDPWTTPLADPEVSTPDGQHSAVSPVDAAATTTKESEIIDSFDEAGTPSPMDPWVDADLIDKDASDITDATDATDATDRDDTKKSSTD